ncbi:MAG: PilZ domain-containing protein [Calditrichaeota bacterium]|nr:MAG: PilZ domain-containing protein [Calditrichota bacterium]
MNERRQSYRIHFANLRQGKIVFQLDADTSFNARLVNLSAGGLCCLIPSSQKDHIHLHQFIEKFYVYPRIVGRPMCASGVVRRVQPVLQNRYLDCAIEFSAVLSGLDLPSLSRETVDAPAAAAKELPAPHNFLARLYHSDNPQKSRRVRQRLQKQKRLHEAYRDIAQQLPAAERWWFYCVLDSLKNSGPHFQKGLLAEYIKLCKKGEQANAG